MLGIENREVWKKRIHVAGSERKTLLLKRAGSLGSTRGDGEGWLRRGFYSSRHPLVCGTSTRTFQLSSGRVGSALLHILPSGICECLLWGALLPIPFVSMELSSSSSPSSSSPLFLLSPLPPCPVQLLELAKPLALPILWPKSRASTGRWMAKQSPLVCRFPVGY